MSKGNDANKNLMIQTQREFNLTELKKQDDRSAHDRPWNDSPYKDTGSRVVSYRGKLPKIVETKGTFTTRNRSVALQFDLALKEGKLPKVSPTNLRTEESESNMLSLRENIKMKRDKLKHYQSQKDEDFEYMTTGRSAFLSDVKPIREHVRFPNPSMNKVKLRLLKRLENKS